MFFGKCKCILCNKYYRKRDVIHSFRGIGVCGECVRKIKTKGDYSFEAKAPLEYVYSPYIYEGNLRLAVKAYKFSDQRAYGVVFGSMLAEEFRNNKDLRSFDYVIPVPLYGSRLIERGFNQSDKLGEMLADGLGLLCIKDALFRVRETKRQSGLKGIDRVNNVKSAFFAAENIVKGKNIILVDDIFTMGETMAACATALSEAGANRVVGVSLCKTLQKEPPLIRR